VGPLYDRAHPHSVLGGPGPPRIDATDGYSPAQLLMGRQLRSTVPTTQQQLQPSTPDAATVLRHDKVAKQRQATNYNRRHRARDGKGWRVGDNVWVPDVNVEGTVTEVLPERQHFGHRSTFDTFIPTTYGQRHRHPSQRQSAATRASAEDFYDAAGSDAITVVYRYADVQRSVSPSRPSSSTTETPTDSGPVGKSVASRRHPFRTPVQTTGPHEPVKGGM
jgi:hypothetical protein